MMRMKVLGVPMVVLVASAVICAAHGKTVSLSPLGGTGASATADDTVKVQGRGVGTTKAEALKDAYRDAIERAIGLYIDAEAAAENDQLIKDQVLTHSNAYITDYRELGEEKLGGGLVRLRILATVQKRALTTKLSGVMPTQTALLNSTGLQNVHAQLVTKEKRAEDAAALLKNALDGINPMKSLMVANIRPETQKVVAADDNSGGYSMKGGGGRGGRGGRGRGATAESSNSSVTLRYLFEVRLDREKYFSEFVPNLKKVLDQISLTPPKEIRLTELVPTGDHLYCRCRAEALQKYIAGEYDCDDANWEADTQRASALIGCRDSRSPVSNFKAFLDPLHVYSILWKGDNWMWQFDFSLEYRPISSGPNFQFGRNFDMGETKVSVYFALITSLNASCSNGKVTMYELDKSVGPVLNAWHRDLLEEGWDPECSWKHDKAKTTNYNIVLLDKIGEEIGVYPWQIPNDALINVKFAEGPRPIRSGVDGMVYATPFVGCFGENLIQWRDFVLEKDDLAKIASVKIELAD